MTDLTCAIYACFFQAMELQKRDFRAMIYLHCIQEKLNSEICEILLGIEQNFAVQFPLYAVQINHSTKITFLKFHCMEKEYTNCTC